MKKTKIEWCDSTLNPVIGCTFGCPFCYAKKLNDRFGFVQNFTKPQFFPERLKQLDSKKPQVIFMDSMSDVADWELSAQIGTEQAIMDNPQHTYLFLTKRPKKAVYATVPANNADIWLGVSIATVADIARLDELFEEEEFDRHHFISFEPLHEDVAKDIGDFLDAEWVIIGAETGNRKGKITPKKEWVDRITKLADEEKIPVFMKNSLVKIMGEENMRREFPKMRARE